MSNPMSPVSPHTQVISFPSSDMLNKKISRDFPDLTTDEKRIVDECCYLLGDSALEETAVCLLGERTLAQLQESPTRARVQQIFVKILRCGTYSPRDSSRAFIF